MFTIFSRGMEMFHKLQHFSTSEVKGKKSSFEAQRDVGWMEKRRRKRKSEKKKERTLNKFSCLMLRERKRGKLEKKRKQFIGT